MERKKITKIREVEKIRGYEEQKIRRWEEQKIRRYEDEKLGRYDDSTQNPERSQGVRS